MSKEDFLRIEVLRSIIVEYYNLIWVLKYLKREKIRHTEIPEYIVLTDISIYNHLLLGSALQKAVESSKPRINKIAQ